MKLHRLIATALLTLTLAMPLAFASPAEAESGCHGTSPPPSATPVVDQPTD